MEQSGWFDRFNQFFYWFSSLAYLNLLWIVFTLIGLVIFGVGPATSALFVVIRKMLQSEECQLTKTFIQHYKKDFILANGLFLVLTSVGAMLVADLYFLKTTTMTVANFLIFLLLVLVVLYIMIALLLFPVFVHFDLNFWENFKYAFLLAMIRPHYIILIIGCLLIAYNILSLFGVLFLFFSISLGAAIIMLFSYKMFTTIRPNKR